MSSPVKLSFLSQDEEMYVTKRNGQKEIVSFDKLLGSENLFFHTFIELLIIILQ